MERKGRACVICTSPRTGSSLLGEGLGSTGRVGRPAEYFRLEEQNRRIFEERFGIDDERDYLEKVIAAGTTPNGVFGLKLHWHQIPPFLDAIRKGRDVPPDVRKTLKFHEFLDARFESSHYFWLRRRNKIAQGISVYRADQTNIWRVSRGTDTNALYAEHIVVFDFAKIHREVRALVAMDRHWNQYFTKNGLQPVTIVYEDYTQRYEAVIHKICRLLKVDHPPPRIRPPAYERQADDISAAWEQEYLEIKRRTDAETPALVQVVNPAPAQSDRARRLKVAVYAIASNDIRNLGRFLQTCVAADVVVVGDTGSTDGTVKALRQGGVVIHNLAIRPWRFDDARNAVLALVPADVDVCIALDFDEELSPGWRDALERDWTSRTTLGPCRRVTTHPQGIPPMVEANVAKIHSRFGYRWTSLCHESLVADRLAQPIETILPRLEIHRRLEASKIAPETYLSMLEAAVAEAPDDTDGLFRLGQQYALLKNWTAAEPMLRRFLLLAGERSPQSRATAWRALANCHTEKGNPRAAIGCLHEGLRIAPGHRDLWLDLAELNASSENWSASIDASRQGLALPLLGNATGNEPRHAGGRPFHQASLVASQLGLAREALALEGEACAKEPAHQDYRERLLALEASEVGRKRAHLHE